MFNISWINTQKISLACLSIVEANLCTICLRYVQEHFLSFGDIAKLSCVDQAFC